MTPGEYLRLMQAVEERRRDPKFAANIERIMAENRVLFNRLAKT